MNIPRSWPRVVPSLLVLTCALVTTVGLALPLAFSELASRQFLRRYRGPNIYEATLAIVAENAERFPDASEIVFIGDSTALCSLDPLACERLTDMKCVNLASAGVIGIEGFTLLLRRYLDHHPQPRAVVFSMHPWALGVPDSATGPMNVRQRFMRCYGAGGLFSLAGCSVTDLVKFGGFNLVSRLRGIGPERHFDGIIPSADPDSVWTYNRLKSHFTEHRGFVASSGFMNSDARWPYSVAFPVREDHKEAMRKLIALTRQQALPLIIRLTPVLTLPKDARCDELRTWLAQLERENSNVTVSRPEILEFGPQYHQERLHLNAAGAEKFTAVVAAEVRRVLAMPGPSLNKRETPRE